MAIDSQIYLINLADVGQNYACFAVYTQYIRKLNERCEVRVPSLLNKERVANSITSLDKQAWQIESWSQLYGWLGRGSGWAAFSQEAATKLVPHWLGENVEYECASFRMESITFVESSLFSEFNILAGISLNLAGSSPDDGSFLTYMDITGNLVLSKRPLFV